MDEVALNFRWLIPFKLAGMKNPARTSDPEASLVFVKERLGITTVVSLQDRGRPDEQNLQSLGFSKIMNQRWYAFDFPAQGMPEAGVTSLIDISETIDLELRAGRSVAVHGGAGIGRTGTVLAAYLVWAHRDRRVPDLLERSVRAVGEIGKAPQSQAQLKLLKEFREKVTS